MDAAAIAGAIGTGIAALVGGLAVHRRRAASRASDDGPDGGVRGGAGHDHDARLASIETALRDHADRDDRIHAELRGAINDIVKDVHDDVLDLAKDVARLEGKVGGAGHG